jgi:uncharacterized protein YecE (DUF72 family)
MIRCGTCAWSDHTNFYPPRLRPVDRLRYYARRFSVVEVDSSYYAIPKPDVVKRWADTTPDDFEFDVKAYRSMTLHDRGQPEPTLQRDAWNAFELAIAPLRECGKLRAILFQFPPWFVASARHRAFVEASRARFAGDLVAVEFRHRSWFAGDMGTHTLSWLREQNMVHVICDEPQAGSGSVPFVVESTHAQLAIFRLHGRNRDTWYKPGLASSQERFDYLYSREELASLAPFVREVAGVSADVHVLLNNNHDNYAVTNAHMMERILGLRPDGDEPDGRTGNGSFDGW